MNSRPSSITRYLSPSLLSCSQHIIRLGSSISSYVVAKTSYMLPSYCLLLCHFSTRNPLRTVSSGISLHPHLPVPSRRWTRPPILVNVFALHDALSLLVPRCCREGVLVAAPRPALALEGSFFLHVADAALAVVLDVLGEVDEVLDVLLHTPQCKQTGL